MARFEFRDTEIDPQTGSSESEVVYLPDFDLVYDHLEKAKMAMDEVANGAGVTDSNIKAIIMQDQVLDKLADDLNRIFNTYRTHLRKKYPDDYKRIKSKSKLSESNVREIIKNKVKEISTTAAGGNYLTKYAFAKKNSNPPISQYLKMGYELVDRDKLRKQSKGIDYKDLF
jgi:predicted transcriptional regulator